jgi:metal-dependent amidase/aminoacylase/carboxypeptidase family protein
MVVSLQMMVTRQFDIFDPVVVTVGTFNASTERNIIPQQATFEALVLRTVWLPTSGTARSTR